MQNELEHLRWRVRYLTERVEKLTDGLRPFAEEGRRWGPQHPGDLVPICDHPQPEGPPTIAAFDVDDLRRAVDLVFGDAPEDQNEFQPNKATGQP